MLERAIGGGVVTDSELTTLACSELSSWAGLARHMLSHWITDADIRARDPDYAAAQAEQLKAKLQELRRG